tara:strand:- start:1198 stop:1689 length:492 start_codon:yes stop_codon:yes gene_type:complete
MDKKEIRSIATAIKTLDNRNATIASRLFEVLKPAINSNDKAAWKQATKEFAQALGFKSMNAYTEEKGGSLAQRVSEFTWSVEGVEYALESYEDYLQAKADMAEAKKAAKDEPTDGDIAEALEATMMQPTEKLLALINALKAAAALPAEDQDALADALSPLVKV